jgi:hypothetical protein
MTTCDTQAASPPSKIVPRLRSAASRACRFSWLALVLLLVGERGHLVAVEHPHSPTSGPDRSAAAP